MSGENVAYVKDSFEGIPKEKAYLNQVHIFYLHTVFIPIEAQRRQALEK